MKKIHIHLNSGRFPIYLGENIFKKLPILLNKYSKYIILMDENIARIHRARLEKLYPHFVSIYIPSGEHHKNIRTVEYLWKKLLSHKTDRKSVLINFGGGVVGDIGGFVAGTYMRGIDYIQVPTTLLSQVDASIGGKTGFNLGDIKNSIGLFNQPRLVMIDVSMLRTLPQRELVSGFAEIIKHGIISDKNYFQLVTAKKPNEYSNREMIKIIEGSCRIKLNIVKQDEKEAGLRKTLNFGHTIGHAIEAANLNKIKALSHGEAISIGMVAESWLAMKLNILSTYEFSLIEHSIKAMGLPVRAQNISHNKVMECIAHDKKNSGDILEWSIPKKIGEAIILPGCDKKFIHEAIHYITSTS